MWLVYLLCFDSSLEHCHYSRLPRSSPVSWKWLHINNDQFVKLAVLPKNKIKNKIPLSSGEIMASYKTQKLETYIPSFSHLSTLQISNSIITFLTFSFQNIKSSNHPTQNILKKTVLYFAEKHNKDDSHLIFYNIYYWLLPGKLGYH